MSLREYGRPYGGAGEAGVAEPAPAPAPAPPGRRKRRGAHKTRDVQHAAPPSSARRRLGRSPLVVAAVGIGAWAYGVAQLHPSNIGRPGLLAGGNPWFTAGLLWLLAALLLELRSDKPRTWVLAPTVVGLIVAIHASVPIIFGTPEYAWVYKHLGVIAAFQHYGHVTDPKSIYQEWPALFAAVAALASLAHVSAASLATWAPLAFELADALLVFALFRLLTDSRRIAWLALVLYEGLIAWVGQDYLSPQAFGYLIWLALVAIVLRWLRRPAADPAPARGRIARLRARVVAGAQPPPDTTRGQRAVAVVLVALLYLAIVAAHQLTPYMALAGIGALTVLDLIRPRWLIGLMIAVAAGYLVPHYHLIAQQFGGLFSGGNPIANAGGAHGTPNASATAVWSARTVDLLILAMWGTTMALIVRRRRRLGPVAIAGTLAFSPFMILFAQSYGGEAIYRVYMFSSPWCALLIAGAVCELRPSRRWPVAVAVSVAALLAGLQGLYGPTRANGFTPGDVAASLWLYGHVPHGALIVLPVDNFPAFDTADYNRYEVALMPADPQFGLAWMNESNLSEVENWIVRLGQRTAYVVVSRSMGAWDGYYGAPAGYRGLERELPTALHGAVVFRNADATVYRLYLGFTGPAPASQGQPASRATAPTQPGSAPAATASPVEPFGPLWPSGSEPHWLAPSAPPGRSTQHP
jgi:hypothetical protein